MLDSIPNLDRRGLRSFGITTGLIVGAVFGLALPWLRELEIPRWPWAVGVVLAALAVVAPISLKPIYRAWMGFGLVMGRVTTPVLMGVLFAVVVTPIACWRSLLGRDPLARRFEREATTYRSPSKPASPRDLERPF